jgi:tetraacyldisaccharide 4'-kinase
VSRGHGSGARAPREVTPDADARRVGDEPLLLALRSRCPVWIGADRAAAGQALLSAHPDVDVLLSDDGLQHYALERDMEIAVVDAERAFGNALLLPAGPLREPVSRLQSVDAVVLNGVGRPDGVPPTALSMRVDGAEFVNLLNPSHVTGPEHFRGLRVHAIAGIGNPARFFAHLQALGIEFEAHSFPDHHA